MEYEDINYSVASTEDQSAIFSGWSSCLNYFDSSLPFQLSFVNRRSRSSSRYKVNIPAQHDAFDSIRDEFTDMLKGQIAKSNNGIERSKYITFGLPAGSVAEFRIILRLFLARLLLILPLLFLILKSLLLRLIVMVCP